MQHRLNLHHWFFSTDLTFYIKGGRISKTAGTIGGLLGICPLLNMNDEGKLIPRQKIRTKKKVIRAIVDKMEEFADNGLEYNGKCYISQSACMDNARAVADLVEARFPNLNGKVANSFYRHCDWKSHRSWNSSSVFLGQHADTLSSRYKPESFRHPNR